MFQYFKNVASFAKVGASGRVEQVVFFTHADQILSVRIEQDHYELTAVWFAENGYEEISAAEYNEARLNALLAIGGFFSENPTHVEQLRQVYHVINGQSITVAPGRPAVVRLYTGEVIQNDLPF